jgi:Ca2+-binding EF-hand superfamily protein
MTTLFYENYEKLEKFIFNFYDFDKDGNVSKENMRVVYPSKN